MTSLRPLIVVGTSLIAAHAWNAWAAPAETAAPNRPNVLFLISDDLNDYIGALRGHPQVRTPNLDRLAARGTLFTNAHVQAPLCNPSRVSMLSGLRPSTTGVYGLRPPMREVASLRERITLPQAFTQAGWWTYSIGKLFHGNPSGHQNELVEWGRAGRSRPLEKRLAATPSDVPAVDWGPLDRVPPDKHTDELRADGAIDAIGRAPADRPFFVSVGFNLPHLPMYAPQRVFDQYPLDKLENPPVREDDRADTPMFSWFLHWKLPEPRLSFLRKHQDWEKHTQAYLAGVTFLDEQIGRVLDALEASGRADNTIIVFWSDHGYHLGEKGITGKNSLWERSTRVPLIFAGPGIARGARCDAPVELLDVFPTLVDLCGLPVRQAFDGVSLGPQLKDAKAPRERPAITTANQGNHGVRTAEWRYIRYADGSEELYDHRADPNEWTNLAAAPEHAATKRRLAAWLPKTDAPPVPGSAGRVLTYDATSGAATWEGAAIDPDDVER